MIYLRVAKQFTIIVVISVMVIQVTQKPWQALI